MPELPEVEITARRLDGALRGVEVESSLATGIVAVKSVDPPLSALAGRQVAGVRRIGKMPVVEFASSVGDGSEPLALLVHLMSAGRLQIFEKRASLRDRTARVLIRLADGRELRLREFGTKQRAWVKLMPESTLTDDEMVATLGPEAWPAPPLEELARRLDLSRHLHPMLRDERVHAALHVLGDAIEHYEAVIGEQVPDKLPMPLRVHRREGEPCPRCGATLAAVHFAEHVTTYCPEEQTGGRVLKDRRLSRLLK